MAQETSLRTKCRRSLLAAAAVSGIVLGLLALAVTLPIPSAKADSNWFVNVIAPDSVAYGRTYSEWSAAWEQWAYSIPVAEHPLFDNGDCSQGQSGPVWFLGGKFCANGANCSYTGVVRSCNVPLGKALYFPIFNGEDSALEEGQVEHPGDVTYQQIGVLRSLEAGWMDPVTGLSCSLDGAPIRDLRSRFRVQSVAFGFTLPTDNYLTAVYGTPFAAGTYFPTVDDGWYLMLAPLPPGPHVLHFHGGAAPGFEIDITYLLHVIR